MKRLAALAFLIVAATASPAGAGSLPNPALLVNRNRPANLTHIVRQDARPKLPSPALSTRENRQSSYRLSHIVRGR